MSNPGQKASRVLIIRQGPTRDMVLALGALKALRDAHPRAEITLIASPETKDFAELCPYVDIVIDDAANEVKKIRTARFTALRKHGFEIVYDLDVDSRSAAIFSGLKTRFGPPPVWNGRVDGAAFPDVEPRGSGDEITRLSRQLHAVGVLADSGDAVGDFKWLRPKLGDPPRLQPAYFGIESPYALIALDDGTLGDARIWPKTELIELSRRLAEAGLKPVFTGAKSTGPLAQDIEMTVRQATNIVARADTAQLIALAETATVVIGTDTAALQIAALQERPCILLRATDVDADKETRLRTPQSIVVHDARLDTVTAETVWRIVDMWNVVGGKQKP